MWACGVSPGLIPLPRPVYTKPNRIFFVSAKFQPRRSRNTNFNYNHYDYDDDDDVEVTPVLTETEESFGNSNFISEETGEQQQVPSGSDILRALQRATVRKHNNKNKKKKQQLRPVPDSKAKQDGISTSGGIGDVDAPVKVKPLRIRSDWSSRLDELELRLQDLLNI